MRAKALPGNVINFKFLKPWQSSDRVAILRVATEFPFLPFLVLLPWQITAVMQHAQSYDRVTTGL